MKTLKESIERKFKDAHKEIDLMNNKLKQMSSEKTRICNMLDAKVSLSSEAFEMIDVEFCLIFLLFHFFLQCHELKSNQKDCEKLKADITALEMKSKWNLVKLKQEMDLKTIAERRVDELNQEVIKLNEISKQKIDSETEKSQLNGEQKMEQQATMILLKHGNDEKEKKIDYLEQRLTVLQTEINEIQSKLSSTTKEVGQSLV